MHVYVLSYAWFEFLMLVDKDENVDFSGNISGSPRSIWVKIKEMMKIDFKI